MRFQPHDRVIDLLVGENFYNSVDAAIRELLQNAEDACALQVLKDPATAPEIVVQFSTKENWVAVADNGLGMNEEAFTKSFAAIGAPKTDVSHIRELLQNAPGNGHAQIGYFGIGILSCFGIADFIEVYSRMDGDTGLAYRIRRSQDDFEPLPHLPSARGTTVRLSLRPESAMRADQAPAAVRRYARHAAHVLIEDVDNGQRSALDEQWTGKDEPGAIAVDDPDILSGFLALDPHWDTTNALRERLVLCNGGFLAEDNAENLLPVQAIGYIGELDLRPGTLTILINREGFKRDGRWNQLSSRLLKLYNSLLAEKVSAWHHVVSTSQPLPVGVERAVFLFTRGQTKDILEPELLGNINALLPHALRVKIAGSDATAPMAQFIERAEQSGTLYYVREDEGLRRFQQNVGDGNRQVQVTELLETRDLRIAHLKAKGAMVASCRKRSASTRYGEVRAHEVDILAELCQRRSIRFVAVEDASPEEVRLDAAPESALVTKLLAIDQEIRLVSVPSSGPVIRDTAGRLLNYAHADVRELLSILPEVVGNPVRRALLQAYMDVETFGWLRARTTIRRLLMDPQLADHAQLKTGGLLRDFLQRKLSQLIEEAADEA